MNLQKDVGILLDNLIKDKPDLDSIVQNVRDMFALSL